VIVILLQRLSSTQPVFNSCPKVCRCPKSSSRLIGPSGLSLVAAAAPVLAAVLPYDTRANPLGLVFSGVSIAFGLTLLTMV